MWIRNFVGTHFGLLRDCKTDKKLNSDNLNSFVICDMVIDYCSIVVNCNSNLKICNSLKKISDIDDSDDYLASSSSSDDGLELINIPKRKNESFLEETVPLYDNETYFGHFRISRHVTTVIADLYKESNYFKKNKYGQFGQIPAIDQVLIFMWYAGHQTSSFRDVADRFNITISTLHRIIERLTYFLSNLSPHIIKWPNEDEKRESEVAFKENGFPMAIGAIDGCHIKIDKPENDLDSYINRKSYYSIHMQVVCDHKRKIIDFFAGYPGSVHDSRVFRNSPLCNSLQAKCGSYFLLGDSGYSLQKNLMTPFKDRGQLTRKQINYNLKLSQNRYRIEHCFGILKQKFRQLYHLKLRKIVKIVHFM